ncbi:hypothetical protein JHV675_51940 [Mycobacterium avium subsp. hominissuis]
MNATQNRATRDFGYRRGALVFAAGLLVVAGLYFWTGVSRVSASQSPSAVPSVWENVMVAQ